VKRPYSVSVEMVVWADSPESARLEAEQFGSVLTILPWSRMVWELAALDLRWRLEFERMQGARP
jgi:hypothetical protein